MVQRSAMSSISISGFQSASAPSVPSPSTNDLNEKDGSGLADDLEPQMSEKTKEILQTRNQKKTTWWSWRLQPQTDDTADTEKGSKERERKVMLMGPFYAGCGAALALCKQSLCFAEASAYIK